MLTNLRAKQIGGIYQGLREAWGVKGLEESFRVGGRVVYLDCGDDLWAYTTVKTH